MTDKITMEDLRREVHSLKKTPTWFLPLRLYYIFMMLLDFLEEEPRCSIYINVHPNRWVENCLAWGVGAVSDWAINQAKWVISLTRPRRN